MADLRDSLTLMKVRVDRLPPQHDAIPLLDVDLVRGRATRHAHGESLLAEDLLRDADRDVLDAVQHLVVGELLDFDDAVQDAVVGGCGQIVVADGVLLLLYQLHLQLATWLQHLVDVLGDRDGCSFAAFAGVCRAAALAS